MPLLFIKLNTGVPSFSSEELGLFLSTATGKIAAALDYSNINQDITVGLNSNVIIQITQEAYYALPNPNPPTYLTPNGIITASEYIAGCPNPTDDFWLVRGGKVYKILWSTLKNCILSSAGGQNLYSLEFTVGDDSTEPGLTLPAPGDTSFLIPSLNGVNKIRVEYNGLPIYNKIDPNKTYFTWDKITKEFTLSNPFVVDDYLAIYQI